MARLKFEDIDEWTPSSISIVDVPSHPLCKFEVYEDDEEYVKKSIEIDDGDIMVEPQQNEEMVSGPASFFKELLGRNVAKADEVPPAEPAKDEDKKPDDLEARIAKLEERISKLENEQKEKKPEEPAPGAVAKSDGEAGESEGEAPSEEVPEEQKEEIIDETEVVSKSIDPDLVETGTSEKSLVERAGRNINGMTW